MNKVFIYLEKLHTDEVEKCFTCLLSDPEKES